MAELIVAFASEELTKETGAVVDVIAVSKAVNVWWLANAQRCRSMAETLGLLWLHITQTLCLNTKHGLICVCITAENPVA
ncbi:hypothetical protein M3M33_14545, partial [Loigolactobacillus coryniformis]|uniref:hypothetical protein n=1 Tax=Loigolactobacillus coryniformis TaxID=1610 RepID=UPI00201B29B4